MRFDVEKERSGSQGGGTYTLMTKENSDFHNALKRRLTDHGGYYTYDRLTRKDNGRFPNIRSRIIIDKNSGKFYATLVGRGKNEKGMVLFDEIEEAFFNIIQFFSVCMDHGYLVADEPEEDTDDG